MNLARIACEHDPNVASPWWTCSLQTWAKPNNVSIYQSHTIACTDRSKETSNDLRVHSYAALSCIMLAGFSNATNGQPAQTRANFISPTIIHVPPPFPLGPYPKTGINMNRARQGYGPSCGFGSWCRILKSFLCSSSWPVGVIQCPFHCLTLLHSRDLLPDHKSHPSDLGSTFMFLNPLPKGFRSLPGKRVYFIHSAVLAALSLWTLRRHRRPWRQTFHPPCMSHMQTMSPNRVRVLGAPSKLTSNIQEQLRLVHTPLPESNKRTDVP
ncbi:hypothetical protein FPV67DRAFT_919964 [Lyophyllum atratum]|nr:hypothetical protein FPV67DRAFT_919964 [Lyophyllum atratum]